MDEGDTASSHKAIRSVVTIEKLAEGPKVFQYGIDVGGCLIEQVLCRADEHYSLPT